MEMAESDPLRFKLVLQNEPEDGSGYISYTIQFDDNDVFSYSDKSSKKDAVEEPDVAVVISDDSNSNDNFSKKEEAKVDDTASKKCKENEVADDCIVVLSSDDSNSEDCIDDEVTSGAVKPRWKDYNILKDEFPTSRDSSNPDKIVYTCPICLRFSGDKRSKVSIHISTVHKVQKPYVCRLCPFRTGRKSGLVSHLFAAHSVKLFTCSTCSFTTFTRTDLTRHVTMVHEKVNNFLCSMCCYRTSTRNHLIKHLSTIHGNNETSERSKQTCAPLKKIKSSRGSGVLNSL